MKTFNTTTMAPANVLATVQHGVQFTVFLKLASAANLNALLAGPGPLTVFLPANQAFERLGQGTVDELMGDTKRLEAVLTYHMVPGKLPISAVMSLSAATTLNGAPLTIYGCNGVTVNDAQVIQADIDCTNGIIHVIDSVLFPR